MVKEFDRGRFLKWLLTLWALLSATFAYGQYDDADLKAVYLYRFALLADWTATGESVAPVEYCVSEKDSVSEHLKKIVARKPQSSRYFDLSGNVSPNTCHILYIPQAKKAQILSLREQYPHSLLISNGEEFVFMGGMVAFVKVNNRIRPMVSRNHVAPTQIQLRAQLLNISLLVEDEVTP
ncbi:YfiR family protein [Vibrio hyugaensis]|uniref:YfiR family protein n=1 Tax=Vibrio hyugaensis TaxID=1534743 RepID=UPI000CE4D037|nr:YfiR family protein [Vibrio hyugaensis]